MINKDFYVRIPAFIQHKLEEKCKLYFGQAWFEDAWAEYREACLSVRRMRDIPDPDPFFALKLHYPDMKASIDAGIKVSEEELEFFASEENSMKGDALSDEKVIKLDQNKNTKFKKKENKKQFNIRNNYFK